MQSKPPQTNATNAPRTNAERTAATRTQILAAARALFAQHGYAATGTPEIVRAAGLTRGALYHHFADKAAVLDAVLHAEATAVAERIEAATDGIDDPARALDFGTDAYLSAMQTPGRARLLLIEGPAVLGPARLAAIDRETGGGSLRTGLAALLGDTPGDLDALADSLSAAFDRAALAIAEGADPAPYRTALRRLLTGLR